MTWNPSTEGPPSREVQALFSERQFRSVLDVGCGWGRNLAPFVRDANVIHGFDLDAEAVKHAATKLGYRDGIRIWQDDIRSTPLTGQYELVICLGVLHFLSTSERAGCYQKIKRWVEPAGFIIIVQFNAVNPIPSDLAELMPDVPADSSEILSAFEDWHVVSHESYTYDDDHDNGRIHHTHSIDRLIARRPA